MDWLFEEPEGYTHTDPNNRGYILVSPMLDAPIIFLTAVIGIITTWCCYKCVKLILKQRRSQSTDSPGAIQLAALEGHITHDDTVGSLTPTTVARLHDRGVICSYV